MSDAQMRCNEVEREAQLQLTVVRQSLGQVPDNIGSLVADLRATSVRLRNELTSAASSQDGEATRLRDVLEQVNVLIGSFNKFSGNLPRTLHEIITRLAEARAGRFWRTAQWYGDNLERQEILSLRVANLLRRPEQSLAQAVGGGLREVDECVRRSEIFRLKDRCAKMVFLPRVDELSGWHSPATGRSTRRCKRSRNCG
ncbi:hypothetical protein OV079_52085 [Nannocystis pusilla]|uniref:Uncharacterized protein n=1 Tax=Nannocystis pusilla TaxID=889268 RepID=A0A9X3J2L5_9BACT|nr:hypothetical protein [Nannocystis pusilla]MCY1013932.1 hypothetical protein [Nannocystis pusilla]